MSDKLESLVQKCIAIHGYTDADFKIESGATKAANYLGIIGKITGTAKDANGRTRTFNWISKTASESEALRGVVKLHNAYLREMFLYEHVFAEYENLQEDHNIAGRFRSYPRFYTSEKSIPETIIMENMQSAGFVMKDRLERMDFPHAHLIMKEFGRLHALSFALRELRPEIFKSFKGQLKEDYFTGMDFDMLAQSSKKRTDKIERVLLDEGGAIVEMFRNYAESSINTLLGLLQPEQQDEHWVICHGDSWVNNMLFKYENQTDVPTSLCFLDFQFSRFGSPAFDLSFFIYTCTDQKLRDESFDDLLEAYHVSLVGLLKEFSLDGEKIFPRGALREQMLKFSRFGTVMAAMVVYLMICEEDEVPDLSALKDNSGDEFSFVSRNEDVYLRRMRDVILDGIKRGYIF